MIGQYHGQPTRLPSLAQHITLFHVARTAWDLVHQTVLVLYNGGEVDLEDPNVTDTPDGGSEITFSPQEGMTATIIVPPPPNPTGLDVPIPEPEVVELNGNVLTIGIKMPQIIECRLKLLHREHWHLNAEVG